MQKKKKKKNGIWASRVKTDIKKTPQVNTEDLSTPGTPTSKNQCMVTLKAVPIEGKSASSAREFEEYEAIQGYTKLENWVLWWWG